MKKIVLFLVITLVTGCSSLKRTLVYSSLAGGMAGATAGAVLSPNKESKGANVAVFGLVGAGIAALAGYVLYKDDPRNYRLKNMLRDQKTNPDEIEIPLGDLKIDANLEKKEAYKVPVKELPSVLQSKVNQQFLIKYQSKERYVKKGNKTFYIPAFDIYEHSYEEQMSGEEENE